MCDSLGALGQLFEGAGLAPACSQCLLPRNSAVLPALPRAALCRQANPFQHRICHVFSTSEDGDDSMSFEDFLDMLSVFSDSATSDIKSHYAFRIFGKPGGRCHVLGSPHLGAGTDPCL